MTVTSPQVSTKVDASTTPTPKSDPPTVVTSEQQRSSRRLRSIISRMPRRALTVSLVLGFLAAILFVSAANQQDLGMVAARVSAATVFGGISLLILNELVLIELDDPERRKAQIEERSLFAGWIVQAMSRYRWWTFAGVVALIGIGLMGPSATGISDEVSKTVLGQSVSAWAAVIGLSIFTAWALVLFLELERGVLVCPQCWLIGGLILTFGGATAWGLTPGTIRTISALITVVGLVGVKMAMPAILDRIPSDGRLVRNQNSIADIRRVRAVEATVGGIVGTIGGALLMVVGANVERGMYLTLGSMVVIAGLSIIGVGAPRLITPLRQDENFTDSRLRLVTTALIATGTLAIAWGATRTVEAAGDWLLLVVVICVIMAGIGAWFAYRGEALVILALITFLLPWVMKDRATIDPAELKASGTSDILAFYDEDEPVPQSDKGIVVALGDSFMSGEGADDYFQGTNSPATNQCRQAGTAFAVLVARKVDRDLRFLACSGATSENVREGGTNQITKEVGGTQLDVLKSEVLEAKAGGNESPVDLVLLSIGGNDTGFSKIIQACLLPTNCAENEDLWIAKAESLQETLTATYEEVRGVVGDEVPIVVVPYPRFIAPEACDRLASQHEFEFVVRFVDALNGTIRRAAKDAGVLVANTPDKFEGQKQCDEDPAVNLIVLSPPAGDSVLDRLGPGNWVHNSMHPRPKGHELQAEVLEPLAATLVDICDDIDCRPNCDPQDVGIIDELHAPGPEGEAPLLIDNCEPPGAVTPDDVKDDRTAAADLLLATVVHKELYGAAGLLVAPALALLSGGLLIAVGLAGRPRTLGHTARFLSPIIPGVSTVEFADRRIHLFGQASTSDNATVLLVTARPDDDPPGSVTLQAVGSSNGAVAATVIVAADEWRYFEAGRNPYHWVKATFSGLEPGTSYRIHGGRTVEDKPADVLPATVTTLPLGDASTFSLVVGSCYYRNSHMSDRLVDAYNALLEPDSQSNGSGSHPLYHFWLGDQVYLDVPWKTGLRAVDIKDQVAKRYLDNWEIGIATPDPEDEKDTPQHRNAERRFSQLLRSSSNWFLPDDHEFWSGYPKVSYRTLPRHAVERRLRNLRGDGGTPFDQGAFGQAAAHSYLVFQSPKMPSPGSDGFGVDRTRPDAVQEIVLADGSSRNGNGNRRGIPVRGPAARILMLDTRWGRTIATRGEHARLMDDKDLECFVEKMERDGLVILMLSRPLAGYPAQRRGFGKEQVTENYRRHYSELLAAVRTRVDRGQPTMIVAGDVHDSSMYSVAQGRLAQVVSSPIVLHSPHESSHEPFLFEGLDDSKKGDKRDYDFQDLLPDLDGSTGGLARLDINVDNPMRPVIDYWYRSLDNTLGSDDGDGAIEQRCRLTWAAPAAPTDASAHYRWVKSETW